MKTLLLCAALAFATTGCTISTQLDPEGSPKYRQAVRGTGSNIARRPDAQDFLRAGMRVVDPDDVERMKRTGGSLPDKMRGG
jgi:hypothetical protein